MTNNFGCSYSSLYDSFYESKDYQKEVDYLIGLVGMGNFSKILDLGCGTGNHDLLLAKKGFKVTGIDLSRQMINQAISKAKAQNLEIEFMKGDIRTAVLGKKFDLVISMFAVMGYQVTNNDLEMALKTARAHLDRGSLFIFDTWYGPAVLHQLPETRVKEFELHGEKILRIAVPEIKTFENRVDVNFTVIRYQGSKLIEESVEKHPMRYFFAPEIDFFAHKCGFDFIGVHPFLKNDREPGIDDWNVTWIMKAA